MKVAMRLQAFPRLSETFILNQISFLLEKNVEVHLFVNQINYSVDLPIFFKKNLFIHIDPSQNKISHLARRTFRKLQHLKNFIALNRRSQKLNGRLLETKIPDEEFDVFHCQYAVFLPDVIEASKLNKYKFKKLITNGRGYDVTSEFLKQPQKYEQLFDKLDLFLPVSQSLAKNYIDYGYDPKKICVLHSGVNLSSLPYHTYSPVKSGVRQAISVGRLVEKKGHLNTIKAVELLIEKGLKLKLTILGEGPLKQELQEYIDSKKLNDYISLPGPKPHREVLSLISKSDVFILSSVTGKDGNQEGIPNVLKESMALGIPFVSTDHGGNKELVPSSYERFLSPENDFKKMSENIEQLFSLESQVLIELLKENRKMIEKEFDINLLTEKLFNIYSGLKN